MRKLHLINATGKKSSIQINYTKVLIMTISLMLIGIFLMAIQKLKICFMKLKEIYNKIHLIVKTTPSSMHSFYELRQVMDDGKFCLTTVDTIFKEAEFRQYIKAWQESNEDGMMAVTDYIDDEKPLYIATTQDLTITGFHDEVPQHYISGGIYGLNEKSFPVIDKCIKEGQSRMRNFQRQLVKDGLQLKAYPFSKILDVDHVSDIEKAEAFLSD